MALSGVCDCHMHIYDPRFTPQNPASIPQRQGTVAVTNCPGQVAAPE